MRRDNIISITLGLICFSILLCVALFYEEKPVVWQDSYAYSFEPVDINLIVKNVRDPAETNRCEIVDNTGITTECEILHNGTNYTIVHDIVNDVRYSFKEITQYENILKIYIAKLIENRLNIITPTTFVAYINANNEMLTAALLTKIEEDESNQTITGNNPYKMIAVEEFLATNYSEYPSPYSSDEYHIPTSQLMLFGKIRVPSRKDLEKLVNKAVPQIGANTKFALISTEDDLLSVYRYMLEICSGVVDNREYQRYIRLMMGEVIPKLVKNNLIEQDELDKLANSIDIISSYMEMKAQNIQHQIAEHAGQ